MLLSQFSLKITISIKIVREFSERVNNPAHDLPKTNKVHGESKGDSLDASTSCLHFEMGLIVAEKKNIWNMNLDKS